MRLLHIIPDLRVGGAERVVVDLLTSFRTRGHDVFAVSLYPSYGTSLECELAEASIPVAFLGKRRGFDPRMFARLYRVLRQFNPDVAHTHLYSLRYALPVFVALRPNAMAHTIHSVA